MLTFGVNGWGTVVTSVGAFMTDRIGSCIRITKYLDADIISNEIKLNGCMFVKSIKSSKNLHNLGIIQTSAIPN